MSSQPMLSSDAVTSAPINLFITGCYRSGTTLLEKLLHSHENICLAEQPFPVLYFYVKLAFYDEIGIKRRYPLDHLFLEDGYKAEDFHAFLDRFKISSENLKEIFDEMADYRPGLQTPEIMEFRDKVAPGTFIEVYHQLNSFVAQLFPKEGIRYLGGKEILCEEYVPYLLSKGAKALIIIRDPRDMITSLDFRERDNLTGANRPILYSLRVWRKSVAIAVAHEKHPNFMWIRYKDLAKAPIPILNRIASFLDLEEFSVEMFEKGIYDQHGDIWKGNSSFDDWNGISTDSVGRFASVLPGYVTAYIESCCWPEMKVTGYDFRFQPYFDEDIVRRFQEPFEIRHKRFSPDYSCTAGHVEEEIERYRKLTGATGPLGVEEAEQWFLYEQTYQKLRSVVG